MNRRGAPLVTEMQVIPVAGHDSMLMNLVARGPFLYAQHRHPERQCGQHGVGEVPGDKIRQTLEMRANSSSVSDLAVITAS
jgi:glucarate dehydratase